MRLLWCAWQEWRWRPALARRTGHKSLLISRPAWRWQPWSRQPTPHVQRRTPSVVAEAGRLLASAQAAVSAWEVSTSSADQAAAAAAVAALMTYEATAAKSS